MNRRATVALMLVVLVMGLTLAAIGLGLGPRDDPKPVHDTVAYVTGDWCADHGGAFFPDSFGTGICRY